MLPLLVTEDLSQSNASDKKRSKAVRAAAVRMAKSLGAPIELVHVENYSAYPIQQLQFFAPIEELLEEQIQELEKLADTLPVSASCTQLQGPPIAQLLARVGDRHPKYEMMVIGTHGRKGVARMLLGSVAEELIRHSPIPVLTVGPKAQSVAPSMTAKKRAKILLAHDLGPNSRKAESYALSLAQRIGAEVTIFHSLYEGFHPVLQNAFATSGGAQALSDLYEDLREDAQARLEKLRRAFTGKKIACKTILEEKMVPTADALAKLVKGSGYDWVVLGTHGRNRVTSAFFGSTARRAILESSAPVITVHSKE